MEADFFFFLVVIDLRNTAGIREQSPGWRGWKYFAMHGLGLCLTCFLWRVGRWQGCEFWFGHADA